MGNGKFPNMKTLNLANNLLTDTTVALLSKLTQVTTLDLTGNDKITDLTSLTSMANLKSLKVHPKLAKQKAVLTSGQTPDAKRTLLIAASVSDVNDKATANAKEVSKLQSTTATNTATIQQLQTQNKEL